MTLCKTCRLENVWYPAHPTSAFRVKLLGASDNRWKICPRNAQIPAGDVTIRPLSDIFGRNPEASAALHCPQAEICSPLVCWIRRMICPRTTESAADGGRFQATQGIASDFTPKLCDPPEPDVALAISACCVFRVGTEHILSHFGICLILYFDNLSPRLPLTFANRTLLLTQHRHLCFWSLFIPPAGRRSFFLDHLHKNASCILSRVSYCHIFYFRSDINHMEGHTVQIALRAKSRPMSHALLPLYRPPCGMATKNSAWSILVGHHALNRKSIRNSFY